MWTSELDSHSSSRRWISAANLSACSVHRGSGSATWTFPRPQAGQRVGWLHDVLLRVDAGEVRWTGRSPGVSPGAVKKAVPGAFGAMCPPYWAHFARGWMSSSRIAGVMGELPSYGWVSVTRAIPAGSRHWPDEVSLAEAPGLFARMRSSSTHADGFRAFRRDRCLFGAGECREYAPRRCAGGEGRMRKGA